MGLLDRLLNKLQRKEEKPVEADVNLKDILFDWFNANNDKIEIFNREFLEPCIEVYKKNEHTQKYITDYPEESFEQYFNQHAILYLAANYPDNVRFKTLFDYLMENENQAYSIKDSIRNAPSQHQFKPDSIHLWDILKSGNIIIKIYHAIYDKRDQNISYLSAIPNYIKYIAIEESEHIFSKVIDYFKKQTFEDKLYVLSNAIPSHGLEGFSIKSVATLNEERQKALDTYNTLDSISIPAKLCIDFDNSFFNIPDSQIYKDTDSKKRRHLKLTQFPDAIKFLADNAERKDAIIKYYILKMGVSYLPKELNKIHKDLFAILCKGGTISSTSFLSIVKTKIESNHALIYNHLLAPILKDESTIGDITEDVVDQFESKLLSDTIHIGDMIEFQPCFDAILSRSKEQKDEVAQSVHKAKYNELYGEVSFNYNAINVNINSTKQGDFVIGAILDKLNLLFPSSLKSLAKQIQYVYYEKKLSTLNIDGADYDFTRNIITELNEVLKTKSTGYRFLPILIQKREYHQNRNTDHSLYKCSIELLNYQQYKYLVDTQLSDLSLLDSHLNNNILFHVKDAPILNYGGVGESEGNAEITFKNNPTWKWFKDDYVDKLESSNKWYVIMDLHMQCKGSSKPNKQWGIAINEAIETFGKERYFKELGSLMSSSLRESFWFLDAYRTTIKGIIWSCALNPSSQSLSIINSIVKSAYTKIPGIGPKSAALGNLGLNAFVLSKSDEAFGIMNLIRNRSKYQRFITAIDKSIDKYLADSPGDAEELADKTIPDFGFIDSKKSIDLDESISAVFLIKNNKLSKKWMVNQKILSSTPSILKEKYSAQEKEVASEFKRINAAYKQMKDRIKTYWLYNREWEYSFWQKHIFNHSMLNSYLENMIWANETKKQTFIFRDGNYVDVENKIVNCDPNDIISLWHPIVSNSSEVSDWQSYIYTNKINQPLRQAFREHYPFSIEESAKTDSKRFAHHFLAVNKLMAIANSAGWVFTYEHEGESWPRKFIKPLNLTVHLKCDYQRSDYAIPTKELYITSDNTVKINARSEVVKNPFSSLPSKTLSEVCRDMDLFIATTSIANDPELSLKTEQQNFYREDFGRSYFSDNATAKVRKQVISAIAPSIGITPVFEKNFLLVQGELERYRINLGSGFAQIADSQKHINLLPDIQPMKKSKKVHSPIQDDETLYIILAKAKYLANDDQIDNSTFQEVIKAHNTSE